MPGDTDILKELKMIIQGLELKKTIFRSNHASNYLPLEGRLPKDRELLIGGIDYALINIDRDGIILPDFLRGL